MIQNSDILSAVQIVMGNVDPKQLDRTTLREVVGQTFDLLFAEMTATDQNWFMKSFPISTADGQIDYKGFPKDWQKPIHATYSQDGGITYTPIDIVNFDDLDDRAMIAWPAIAFYDTPPTMRVSVKVRSSVQFLIWYYPDISASRDPGAQMKLFKMFFTLCVLRAADRAVVHCKFTEDENYNIQRREELRASWAGDLATWNRIYSREIVRPKARGRIEKRPYIAGY